MPPQSSNIFEFREGKILTNKLCIAPSNHLPDP
jgi:hypothetical protein